ncbi:MAG: hypothetical protein GY845_39375 [Planctomycetes bacterium]|nr:hypothetical protein [Planctomycetota bacterium]
MSGIDENFGPNLIGDLDALCNVDLMGVRYNNQGNEIYTVKQAGYDAVRNNFVMPETSTGTRVNIGAIVHQMSGGNLQAIGFADRADIQQIVNDPELLEEQINELVNQLLETIKAELPADKLVSYIKVTEDLKRQMISDSPSPTVLQRLFASLALMGDVEGAISLVARVWPFIYPLLVIAVEKIASAG